MPESIEQSVHVQAIDSLPHANTPTTLQPSTSAPRVKMHALYGDERVSITKAESFAAFGGGDTQPWDSQDLVESSKSMIRHVQHTPQRSNSMGDITLGIHESTVGPDTDESGPIDLGIDNFSPATSQAGRDFVHTQTQKLHGPDLESTPPPNSQAERDFLRDDTQPQTQLPAAVKDFPETPALAGHKRRRNGELLTSATASSRSPRYTQLFNGHRAPVMTNTQLFGLSDSSPALDLPQTISRSDPIQSRPSPNMNSSLAPSSPPNFSSPVLHMRQGRVARTASNEPVAHYRSMKESQEERQKTARLAALANKEGNFDPLDHELMNRTPSFKRRQAQQRTWSTSDLARIRAPVRFDARPKSAQGPIEIRSDSPATAKKRYNSLIDLTAAGEEEELPDEDAAQTEEDYQQDLEGTQELPAEEPDVMYSERDEPPEVYDDAGSEQDAMSLEHEDDNDEYDEFGQTLRSQSQFELQSEDNASATGSLEDENDIHMADAQAVQDDAHDRENHGISAHQTESTQMSTIADSQPTSVQRQDRHSASQPAVRYSSYVPGSQHQGKTSQEMALLNAPEASNQSRVLASQLHVEESAEIEHTGDETLSSPLAAIHDNIAPENSSDDAAQQEILESDNLHDSHLQSQTVAQQEHSLPLYSTARTHVSGSARSPAKLPIFESPQKHTNTQRSRLTDQSPAIRRFADIAAMPSIPVDPSFDAEYSQVDITAVLNNVFTEEDQQLQKLMLDDHVEGPRPKRLKRVHTASSSRSTSSRSRGYAELGAQAAHNTATVHVSVPTATTDSILDSPPEPSPAVPEHPEHPEHAQHSSQPALVASASISDQQRAGSLPPALKDSPSKANRMPATATNDENEKSREFTTDSVRAREEAGNAAVSQLVALRTKGKRSKQTLYGRTGRRKSGRVGAQSSNKTGKDQTLTNGDTGDDVMMAEEMPIVDATVMGDADETPVESAAQPDTTAKEVDDVDEPTPTEPVAHDRIFALFKGRLHYHYPATWLGSSLDGTKCKVRFDDQTVTNIETSQVRRLELRIGDTVKVDEKEKRKKNWVIVGFGPMATTDEERALGTDVFGHTHVKVQPKSGRESLSQSTSSTPAEASEVHTVLVNYLYLTTTMWPQYNLRTFEVPSKASAPRAETPSSTRTGTPSTTNTPRSRRAPVPIVKAKGTRTSHLRETSAASPRSASSEAMFAGMAFAISFLEADEEKQAVTKLIQRNGGIILEDGFEELFDLPDISGSSDPISPSKGSPRQKDVTRLVSKLQLNSKYKELRFAALIANVHTRRAKYMQALALGLPTISGRWIVHSLDESKNPSKDDTGPLPWGRYLLPAGHSTFLNAIRSRTLATYDAATASLELIVESRARLLNDEGLVLVAPKTAADDWKRRKTYAFLTMACGAGTVKRVGDVQEAKKLTLDNAETWKWVYIDSSVADAEKVLFGKDTTTTAGKKRKRGSEATIAVGDEKMSATDGVVKIVNDEFVVQSLILGALVE